MLDLVKVFKDFYDPKDFVKFKFGANKGQKMMSFTDAKKKNNKHLKGCAHTTIIGSCHGPTADSRA